MLSGVFFAICTGPHVETNHPKEVSSVSSMTKKWTVPRQACSYSDTTELNEFDILDNDDIVDSIPGDKIHSPQMTSVNHHTDIHRQNIVNSMKHGVSG